MNYWKKAYVVLLFACMCSIGCGQEIGNEVIKEKKPPKTISYSITTIPEVEMEEKFTGTIIGVSDGFPINREIVIDIDGCNAMNRKLTRDMDSGASLFCIDENEVVYFVNQNHDNYLYCRKNGVTELVVDLPVKEVYPWEDSVYFMMSESVEEKKAGDIYQYSKTTKEIELVYALGSIEGSQNHKMTVNEQGIHFNYSQVIAKEGDITRVKVSSYTLPFGSTEPKKDTTKMGKVGWGDYYFSYEFKEQNSTEPVTVSLVSRTNGKSDTIPLSIGDFQYCVVNDMIYSMELGSASVSVFDLQTKKKQRYDFRNDIIEANSYLKEEIQKSFGDGMEEFVSFTTTENGAVIWITDGEYLYRMDTKQKYSYPMITADSNRKIETLYTDGRNVYGLYASERTGVTSLVRFCTEEIYQEYFLAESEIAVEYLVQ